MNWCGSFSFLVFAYLSSAIAYGIDPIERRVPPIGIEIPDEIEEPARERLASLETQLANLDADMLAADVDVLLKSVQFAIDHREIYKPGHLDLLNQTLDLAEQRLSKIKSGDPDWIRSPLTVRGFYSRIDNSPQPYGIVMPEGLPNKPVPLYVWLHGRGDKTTDIHFIRERLTKKGQISPHGAIVLHPFGRQCLGYKSAGETDVFEAIEHAKANYPVDPNRVVLMGFSMGGAGAWHLGAHFVDQFIAVSPGAGFAETSRYQKYTREKINATPSYERTLWGLYDVPDYVRNLFNVPVVCYSGEKDKQIQAAQVMEAAYQQEGRKLDHVIGPGMGHKYHPDALAEILAKMDIATKRGQETPVRRIYLQTKTLRYPSVHWVRVDRLEEHWKDARVDARLEGDTIQCKTKNILQLTISPVPAGAKRIEVDGTTLTLDEGISVTTHRSIGERKSWSLGVLPTSTEVVKKPGLQGPIDDAFVDRFLVITPTSEIADPIRREWTAFELQHLRERWSALFRGTLPEKPASDITDEDIENCNLILFGDGDSNELIRRVFLALPEEFRQEGKKRREAVAAGGTYVVQAIRPNPLNPKKYVVFNSGPTFREGHDRTNSLQNPKLPDWSILDITTPPNSETAGRVVAAGFFDEQWQFKPNDNSPN